MVNSIQFPMAGLPGVILESIITQFLLTHYLEAWWIKKSMECVAVTLSNGFSFLLTAPLSSLSLLVAAFKHNLIIHLHFLFCTAIPIVFH